MASGGTGTLGGLGRKSAGSLAGSSSSASSSSSSSASSDERLDEHATDLLFELEKALQHQQQHQQHQHSHQHSHSHSADRVALMRHQAMLEKLFYASILPRCDNYLLRTLAASCLVRLYEGGGGVDPSNAYHELLKFLEAKELTMKVVGLQWSASEGGRHTAHARRDRPTFSRSLGRSHLLALVRSPLFSFIPLPPHLSPPYPAPSSSTSSFASLSRRFGSQFLLSLPELLGLLAKVTKARDELVVKHLVLEVVDAYYEGTSGSSRSAGATETTYLEMVKLLTKLATTTGATSTSASAAAAAASSSSAASAASFAASASDVKSRDVRRKVASVIRTVVYYSVDCRELDPLLTVALRMLQVEPEPDVRYHVADALGDALSFALRKDWAKIGELARKSQAKPVRKVHGEVRTLDDVWALVERLWTTTNMMRNATTATAPANLALRTAYAHMLSRCLRNMCANNALNLAGGAVRLNYQGDIGTPAAGASGGGGGRCENTIDETNVVVQVQRWLSTLSKAKFTSGAASGPGALLGGSAALAAFSLPTRDPPVIDAHADQNARHVAALASAGLLTHLLPFQSERALEAVGKTIVATLAAIIKTSNAAASASAASSASSGGATASSALAQDLAQQHQVLVCFQVLGYLFSRLGLAVEYLDLKDQCLEVLLFFLNHPAYLVRVACAQCFRALARAASPQMATWLSVLYKIVVMQLVEVTDSQENAQAAVGAGQANRRSVEIDPTPYYSLHGHISALAAIVGVLPEAPCGVPNVILESIFDVAKKLLSLAPPPPSPSSSASAATGAAADGGPSSSASPSNLVHLHTLVESGWLLLSSLISLGLEWNQSRLNGLFALWRACLGKKPPGGRQTQESVNLELRVRTKALVALRTFIQVMRFRMQMTLVAGVWTVSRVNWWWRVCACVCRVRRL